ncbi:MAG TPA: MFS transporter [Marmoricola sp.]|nr:MFS transporter [Marmoricola sp.]
MNAAPLPAAAVGVEAVQRRTLRVLVASQSLGGLGTTVGIAVAAVLAEEVSGSEALAGLVQTFQVLGAAAASYVLARIMGARGRRVGLVTGYLVGALGGATCVVGGAVDSFVLLLLGALLLGANSATNYQSRYAAADLAVPERRARALSVVLWATTFGAVLGPNLVGPAGRLAVAWGLPTLTGPFVVSVAVALAAGLVIWTFLRPDPLLLARVEAGESPTGPRRRTSWARVRELARVHPGIGAAVLAMSAAHAVMVAIMIMTPLHMDHGGAELEVIGFVISIHVLGMFFFSPFIGAFADRLGRPATLFAGAALLWGSLVLAGTSPEGASVRIGAGLFLLGLGWSCCTVAASALITESTPLESRTDVQGAADLLMNVSAAGAGLVAGVVVELLGFGSLNVFAGLLVLGVLAAVAVSRREPALVA